MIKQRRMRILMVQAKINELMEELNEIKKEEQYNYDYTPEILLSNGRGKAMEKTIDNLELAINTLEKVGSYLADAAQ